MIKLPSRSMDIGSISALYPLFISYVEILIFPFSSVSRRTPSIAVMVFLFDTEPIAGASFAISADFCTVNFIYLLLRPSVAERKYIY